MASLMVTLKKESFRDARTAAGERLDIGLVAHIDRYESRHKSLLLDLPSDLYLISVRDEELWLVGILRDVRDTGNDLRAPHPNVTPVTVITPIASALEFTTGAGIAGDMRATLQTPRVLTEADVALIEEFITPPRADAFEQALSTLASHLVGRPLDDEATYAAFWRDEGFREAFSGEVDWKRCKLDAPDWATGGTASPMDSRADIDLSQSLAMGVVRAERLREDSTLEALVQAQGGGLYGAQLAKLLDIRRLLPEDLDQSAGGVFGRITTADRSLRSTLRALLHLRVPFIPVASDAPAAKAATSAWTSAIEAVEDSRLRAHLSAMARQMSLTSPRSRGGDPFDAMSARYEVVARWSVGGGRGEAVLVRELEEGVPEVPKMNPTDLKVHYVSPPTPIPGDEPMADGTTAELDAISLLDILREEEANYSWLSQLATLKHDLERGTPTEEALERFMAEPESTAYLISILGRYLRYEEGKRRRGAAWLKTTRPAWSPISSWRASDYDIRSVYGALLFDLESYAEALEMLEEALDVGKRIQWNIGLSHHAAQAARCCYYLGDYARGELLALRPAHEKCTDAFTRSTLAVLQIALGDEKTGFKALEKVMRSGVDPKPNAALKAHPKYLELAARYRIPVIK